MPDTSLLDWGHMTRRTFIAGLAGAAALPLAARAQQTGMPVVGVLSSRENHSRV